MVPEDRPADLPSFPRLCRVERLGGGGMGTVFRAFQDELGRAVAVKVLRTELCGDPALRRQFAHEARVLAGLDDPAIVPVYYAGDDAERPYYVMRLVDGVAVDRGLAGKAPQEVAAVFEQIARALGKVHRAGVLHRDLKPDNVLVEAGGRAVLVDFGLASPVGASAVDAGDEPLVGTLDFLAPELLAEAPATVASDVYALGATLYVVLTGSVPFAAATLAEKVQAIRSGDPPLPRALRPDVPKALQGICLKAMEREPAHRYATADDFARDLERFRLGEAVAALPVRARALLRARSSRQLAEHAEWVRQGLIDERQGAELANVHRRLLEPDQALLRNAFVTLPNLLLFAGIVLCVFGPPFLQQLAWAQYGPLVRLALPGVPLLLLGGLGVRCWRQHDRRRGVACLLGATLLVVPFAFALCDLVPGLDVVVDGAGNAHAVVPGDGWDPGRGAPDWLLELSLRLHWKLLLTFATAAAVAVLVHRRTRAAAFVWVACLGAVGVVVTGGVLLGFPEWPLLVRWSTALGVGLGAILFGARFGGRRGREVGRPFQGIGFLWVVAASAVFLDDSAPLVFCGLPPGLETSWWSAALLGLAFTAGGLVLQFRREVARRRGASAPLLVGFLFSTIALHALDRGTGPGRELLLVAGGVLYLVLGLVAEHGPLVVLSSIALPIAIGRVTQRHVDAVWAWSLAIVLGGVLLVAFSFRLAARRARKEAAGANGGPAVPEG